MRRTVVVVVVVTAALGGLTSPVGAGTVWTIQASPNPRGKTLSSLYSVSCVRATTCTAVGQYVNGGTTLTLAENWNGARWTIQSTPNPSRSSPTFTATLSSIACPSATRCVAVGGYSANFGASHLLVELWNGRTWTIQHAPEPAGATASSLYGVVCASDTACTAVGYSDNPSEMTLVERWNGSAWAIQHSPDPLGSQTAQLNSVACPTVSSCTAVGHYRDPSNTFLTWSEHWDGATWTIQATPSQSGQDFSSLSGVACTSPPSATCMAVGSSDTGGFVTGFAELWDGTSWTLLSIAYPSGGYIPTLGNVSCTSTASCIAVGSYQDQAQSEKTVTLAEKWDGATWTVEATPNVTAALANELFGVSCIARTCTAVGLSEDSQGLYRTLVEHQ